MTVLSRLLSRSIENPDRPLTDSSLLEVLGGTPSHSGITVTGHTAMRHIAVFRCVELIAGTCAALPLKAYRGGSRERVINAPVLDDPHPELTRFEVWEQGFACLLLWGNAYFRKLRDGTGKVRYLWPIHPARVRVDLVDADERNPGGKVFAISNKQGQKQPYTSYEILHIPGLGYDGRQGLSRISLAAQGIGVGLAAEEYAARFFGEGQHLSGVLTSEHELSQTSADLLKARWREKMTGLANAHDIAVLDNNTKFQPVSIPAKDAQLLETRQYSTTEIARLFGLPPHAIGDVEKSTSWGSGIEQQTIGMVQFTLAPSYLSRVEQRLTKEVLGQGLYAEYVVEGLLRGDAKSRAEFYTAMRAIKAMTANEVRARENLEPYEGGDVFENPNITVDEPQPVEDERSDENSPMTRVLERISEEMRVAILNRKEPVINVQPAAAPEVHIAPAEVRVEPQITVEAAPVPNVTVEAPPPAQVQVDVHQASTRTIERDEDGQITKIIEE